MNPGSWHKASTPALSTNPELNRFGPGHSSFTVADDGKTDVLLYHARPYRDLRGNAFTDPNRHTYAEEVRWNDDGRCLDTCDLIE